MAEENPAPDNADGNTEENVPDQVTIGSILSDDVKQDGKIPGALTDYADVVIPGEGSTDEDRTAFNKKFSSLAKSYVDTKSMVGGMVKMPGEDADDETKAKFREKVGLPPVVANADDYELKLPEIEGIEKTSYDGFKDFAVKENLSNDQVQKIIDFQAGLVGKQETDFIEQQKKVKEDGVAALKKDYGDAYDSNMAGVKTFLSKKLETDDPKEKEINKQLLTDIVDNLGANPAWTKLLVDIWKGTRESGKPDALNQTKTDEGDIKTLQTKIDELMTSDKYRNSDATTHKKVADLIKQKQQLQGTFKEDVKQRS